MPNESPNGNEPGDGLSPFERFERLARRIVAVPKAEVDERRKQEERNKRRRAARRAS